MTTEAAGRPLAQGGAFLAEVVRNRWFMACVILLAIFSTAFKILTRNVQFRKLPVPLKKPLDQLNHAALFPYVLRQPFTIKAEILDELGTKEYVHWLLEDTANPLAVPEKYVQLFVTYYTGKPDQVPHVPEICYIATGSRVVGEHFEEVPIPALGPDFTIPIKVLEFEGSRLLGRQNSIVMYTFHANGRFCRDRQAVRVALGNRLHRHAYFSKLEVTFGSQEQAPDKAEAIAAGKQFLQVVVPILIREHWPDWESVLKSEGEQAAETEEQVTDN